MSPWRRRKSAQAGYSTITRNRVGIAASAALAASVKLDYDLALVHAALRVLPLCLGITGALTIAKADPLCFDNLR